MKGLLSSDSGPGARKQALTSLRRGFTATGQQECAQEFLRYLTAGSPLFRHHITTTLTCDGCGEERLLFDQGRKQGFFGLRALWRLTLVPDPSEAIAESAAKRLAQRFVSGVRPRRMY